MAVNYIRQTSEEPNITNAMDARAFRFAFGNQDGYIPGRGNELEHEIDGSTFKIKAGEFVIQGCQIAIDSAGALIEPLVGVFNRYYTVYARLNLATEIAEVLSSFNVYATYPAVPASDDLTADPTGTAYVELYRFFINTSGVISSVVKRISAIAYYTDGAAIKTGTVAEARLPATLAKINGTYADMAVGNATNAVQSTTKSRHDNSVAIATTAYVDRGFEDLYFSSAGELEVNTANIANWANYNYFQVYVKNDTVGHAWVFMPRTATHNVDNTLSGRAVRVLTSAPLRLFNNAVLPMAIGYLKSGSEVTATLTSSDTACRILKIIGVK